MIPENFEQWFHCITGECGIKLTPDYITDRQKELSDRKNPHTLQIIRLYGEQHYNNLISWFSQAAKMHVKS
jgi:hypothetical protein